MLRPFLGVGEQAFAVLRILKRRLAARAGARNRADRHFAVADADEDFGRGADQGKARQVQIIEEGRGVDPPERPVKIDRRQRKGRRSEEHTSELQSLMRKSYAVFCLKKKNK